MDSEQLLYDINELNHLFRESASVETLLNKAVEMVAERTQSAVCSIYLYNSQKQELTLRATRGLNPESVGRVRMKIGQGLTGLTLKEMRTVCETDASHNPNYQFFPGIFEEQYNAFLAVPISRGLSRMGVLVLQRSTGQSFSEPDVAALETVASQLGNIIENAQFIMGIHEPAQETPKKPPAGLKFIKGKIAAEGFAYAPTLIVDKQRSLSFLSSRDHSRTYSLEDFRKAVAHTESQLEQLQEQVEHKLSDAASLIFAAHLMILKDRDFLGRIIERIEAGISAPAAVAEIATGYMQTFLASDSAYMREKASDIEDLAIRLVNNLVSTAGETDAYRDHVVVTRGLFPSDLLKLSSEGAVAVVLVGGGVTSHISILARSLAMPMVITDTFDLLNVPDGTPLLIDAEMGDIFIDPDDDVLGKFWAHQRARLTLADQKKLMKPVTATADGTRIRLTANINLLTDLKVAVELNCDGIGLYRTEFPFIIRSTFPSEAEQYVIYRKLVESMPGKPVTFRTLDAGGDKILSYYHDVKEQNPAMGMRSIRFSLQNKAIFAEQVRAILRASAGADLRIMFPMISSLEEFHEACKVVHDSITSLAKQDIDHNGKPSLGMMVELPAVVDLADEFAREADFFSIGTNDLIQFMLAADRTNENVASFYLPHHPAVLRTLSRITRAAIEHDCDVSICGDMAHDTRYATFLLGIGVKAFSVDPVYLLRIQQAIGATSLNDAQNIAKEILSKSRISDIAALLPAKVTPATQ